jgi:hypothetical protein
MLSKRINNHLSKVFDNFVESISDPKVKEAVQYNSIIAGGAISSLINSEKPKDYDIYFRNKHTALLVARYYAAYFNRLNINTKRIAIAIDCSLPIREQILEDDKYTITNEMLTQELSNRVKIFIKSAGVASEEQHLTEHLDDCDELPDTILKEKDLPKYRPVFLSTNAITLSNDIQLVIRFYGEPNEIFDTYDFVHCCNSWDSKTRFVSLNKDALEALINKQLIYRGSKYPVCSLFRLRKFLKKGWKISVGQIFKIAYQCSLLDLDDIHIMEDQLIGVDTAYFESFISALKENKPEKISASYVNLLIDKIF